MDKRKLRNDIVLLAALLAAAFAVWGVIRLASREGKTAVVELNGRAVASYPLDTDIRAEIPSEGGHMNVLVIKDGKASVESADCPDKLCVKQRPVSKAGQTIICLPHKLIIRIEGESGVDAEL